MDPRHAFCYLYHHLVCVDHALGSALLAVDCHCQGEDKIDEEFETYERAGHLYNTKVLLRLSIILRAAVTTYFFSILGVADCPGHANYLNALCQTMQQRQPRNMMPQYPDANYRKCLMSTSKRQRVEQVEIVRVAEHAAMEKLFSPLVCSVTT